MNGRFIPNRSDLSGIAAWRSLEDQQSWPRRLERQDAQPTTWRWGSTAPAGGAGNTRVGPGWDDPRMDAGEIELMVDGRRCVQTSSGEWVREDGTPCDSSEAG